MNLSETILALDQKEEQLLAELQKVREASSTIKSLFNHVKMTNLDKVEKTSSNNLENKRDINDTIAERNVAAAKTSILHLINEKGTTFDYIRRKSRSKSGKMYSPQTVKRYISTLTSSKLIERKKNKYFKLS